MGPYRRKRASSPLSAFGISVSKVAGFSFFLAIRSICGNAIHLLLIPLDGVAAYLSKPQLSDNDCAVKLIYRFTTFFRSMGISSCRSTLDTTIRQHENGLHLVAPCRFRRIRCMVDRLCQNAFFSSGISCQSAWLPGPENTTRPYTRCQNDLDWGEFLVVVV